MGKSNPAVVEQGKPTHATIKPPKHRSPNYPAISLLRAIERAKGLYDAYKRGAVPVMVAMKKWGHTQADGQAAQLLAALRSYGLIEVDGAGEKRTVKISERAQMILGNHPERLKFLRQSALEPPIFKDLWEKRNSGDAQTDEAMDVYLRWHRKFNPNVIKGIIADFRETISLAELTGDYKMVNETPGDEPTGETPPEGEPVMQGIEKPAKQSLPPKITPLAPGIKQDTYTADTGEVVVRWPTVLSQADFDDLEGWLEMLKRKIRRSVSPSLKNDGPAKIEMEPA